MWLRWLLALAAVAMCSGAERGRRYRNVGYVFQRNADLDKLDVSKVTHLNYSFGLLYNNEHLETNPATGRPFGMSRNADVRTPEVVPDGKLHTIYLAEKVARDLARIGILRTRNPKLKILLSVGGWEARGFSDMASTEQGRKAFAASCRAVIDEYKLDGIDIDWEYPVSGGNGAIKARPADRTNFTLMLREVRSAIGKNKLLSIAGAGHLKFASEWTEFREIAQILDLINIMTYDFQYGTSYFGAALYASQTWPAELVADEYYADKSVRNYIRKGCPPEKINLGLSFAAVTPQPVTANAAVWAEVQQKLAAAGYRTPGVPGLKRVKDYLEDKNGFERRWDDDAQNMYIVTKLANGKEQFVLSYIEPRSVSAKVRYVKELGLGGVMFWEFSADYDNSLVAQLHNELR